MQPTGRRDQQVDLVRVPGVSGEGEVRPGPERLGLGQQLLKVRQRFALVRDASDDTVDASLPPGYEALEVDADGAMRPADLVEDELILAVPLVPAMPGSEAVERDWAATAEEEAVANPFAALAALKKT